MHASQGLTLVTLGLIALWCCVVALLAKRRKRRPWVWFLLSVLISPAISMLALYSLRDLVKLVKISCPSCGEPVATWDAECRHCKFSLKSDTSFIERARKADNMSLDDVADKNRIAGEGYEAFKCGQGKSDNPYASDGEKASYWFRGFALAEKKKQRGEYL